MAIFGIPTSKADLDNAGWLDPLGGAVDRVSKVDDFIGNSVAGFAYGGQQGAKTPGSPVNQIANNAAGQASQAFDYIVNGAPGGNPAQQDGATGQVQGVQTPVQTGGGTGETVAQQQARQAAEAAAARAAAAEAKRQADLTAGRGRIKDLIGNARDIYAAIFGNLDEIGVERRGEIEGDYGEILADITQDFENQIPVINQGFAGLGLGQSTYRSDALGDAQEGTDRAIRDTNKLKSDDLASLGSYLAGQRTSIIGP